MVDDDVIAFGFYLLLGNCLRCDVRVVSCLYGTKLWLWCRV